MNLFIGCTSRENVSEDYINDSSKLLEELSKIDNVDLVFGSYHKGLMKVAYDAFKDNNKKITGVLTEYHKNLAEFEYNYDETIVVDTTTNRFYEIFNRSDVILILPGGLGTLAELFSAIEERRIENYKKIIIYNSNYFYTPIIEALYKMYQDGFTHEVPSNYMVIESDYKKIVEIIKEMN